MLQAENIRIARCSRVVRLNCSLLAKQIFYFCSCSQKNRSARMLANARKDHLSPLVLQNKAAKIILNRSLYSSATDVLVTVTEVTQPRTT